VLRLPPRRERLDDIPLLVAHLLKKHGGPHPPSVSPEALKALIYYAWPRNVRELQNALMHSLALLQGDVICQENLPATSEQRNCRMPSTAPVHVDIVEPLTEAKRRAAAEFERRYLVAVMSKAKGSVSEAARLAGLDRTNFRRLLQRHGLDAASFKANAG